MASAGPRALDRFASSRWGAWTVATGFTTVRGWLYYAAVLNALALVVVALDALTPTFTISVLAQSGVALAMAIRMDRQQRASSGR